MHGQECKGYVLYQEVEGMILCSECMAVSKQAFFDLINGFQQSVEVIVPTHFCEEGMPCDNTLICIHDVKRLCELTHITKEEAVFFQTDGKTWYLPEWA